MFSFHLQHVSFEDESIRGAFVRVCAAGGEVGGFRDDGLVWCTQCMFDICVCTFLNGIFGTVLKMSAVK